MAHLKLGDVELDVVLKDIKNVHLSVYPPRGHVRISAPSRMSLDTIRAYAIAKLPWIKRQQRKLRQQEREPPREFVERESHVVWGRRYLLRVVEADAAPRVELQHSRLVLQVRPETSTERRRLIMDEWYREQIRSALPPLLAKWEPLIGLKVERVFIQRMKTRWGSCAAAAGSIRLNTDLARKPPECLEYIVVHEMVHLLEPSHNARFLAFMHQFMPGWRSYRDRLNQLPVRHEDWTY
jgi:predicted metal-dependent hydrolase